MVMEGIAPLGTLDPQHAIARFATALADPARAFAFMRGHGSPPRGMLRVFFPSLRSIPRLRHWKERPPEGGHSSQFQAAFSLSAPGCDKSRTISAVSKPFQWV